MKPDKEGVMTKLSRGLSVDLVLAVVLFLGAAVVSARTISRLDAEAFGSHQDQFGPAVMLGCGRGFTEPKYTPALLEFLRGARDSFSCSDLPAKASRVVRSGLSPFTRAHEYLFRTLGSMWSARGVSWAALTPLYALLYAATIGVSYGIFRLATNRVLAVGLTILWMLSPLHLAMLPNVRDYAKAPFILAGVLIMGHLIMRPVSRSSFWLWCGLGGVITGFGLGFRADMLILVPIFALVALLFVRGTANTTLAVRFSAIAIFFGAFLLLGWPILSGRSGGTNTYHYFMFGLASHRTIKLGITPGVYEWMYQARNDREIVSNVESFAYCRTGAPVRFRQFTQAYDQAGRAYFLQIVRHFPADFLTRAYASTLTLLGMSLPALMWDTTGIHDEDPRMLQALRIGRLVTLDLRLLGFILYAAAALVVSLRSRRAALFLCVVLLYLGGIGSLYFEVRHVAYLLVLPLLAIGVVVQPLLTLVASSVAWLRRVRTQAAEPVLGQEWKVTARRLLSFAAVVAAGLLIPLYSLRAYQQAHVGHVLQRYLASEVEPLETASIPIGEDRIVIDPEGFPAFRDVSSSSSGSTAVEYLVVEIGAEDEVAPLKFRYSMSPAGRIDFGRFVVVGQSSHDGNRTIAASKLLWPVFESSLKFEGLEAPAHLASSIKLYRVTNSCDLPLPLLWTLPHEWETMRLYQTISWQ